MSRRWPGREAAVEAKISRTGSGATESYTLKVTRKYEGTAEKREYEFEDLDEARDALGSFKAGIDGPEKSLDQIANQQLEQT